MLVRSSPRSGRLPLCGRNRRHCGRLGAPLNHLLGSLIKVDSVYDESLFAGNLPNLSATTSHRVQFISTKITLRYAIKYDVPFFRDRKKEVGEFFTKLNQIHTPTKN